jgi:hypothetical protein
MSENAEKKLLNEWNVEAKLPATFNSQVWRRIEQRQQAGLRASIARWVEALFARPASAAAFATVAILAGLVGGHLHGSANLRAETTQWEARYLQSVDPYASHLPQ